MSAAGACTKRQQRRQRRQHSVKRHEAAEARAGRTPEADNVDASDTGTKPLDTKQSPTAPKPDRGKVADVPDDGGRAVPLREWKCARCDNINPSLPLTCSGCNAQTIMLLCPWDNGYNDAWLVHYDGAYRNDRPPHIQVKGPMDDYHAGQRFFLKDRHTEGPATMCYVADMHTQRRTGMHFTVDFNSHYCYFN